jgi:hypothetical protein
MRITAERATAMLLALDEIWRYAVELDYVDPSPVAVLRWLRARDLATYRPPDGDVHPVGEWSASDIGITLADSFRNGDRRREDVLAIMARVVAGEPFEQILTSADVAAVEEASRDLSW